MATPKSPRRISPSMTSDEQRRTVESMLREIAYVLHVTRKVNREIPWPITVPVGSRNAQPAPETHLTAV
jgi:hypothetical protein